MALLEDRGTATFLGPRSGRCQGQVRAFLSKDHQALSEAGDELCLVRRGLCVHGTMPDRLQGQAWAPRTRSLHKADSWPPGVMSLLEKVLRTVCRWGPETLT